MEDEQLPPHECGEHCLGPDYVERMKRGLAGSFYMIPHGLTSEQFIAFMDVVVKVQADATATERERCAKLCDSMSKEWIAMGRTLDLVCRAYGAADCAEAIRNHDR